MQHVTTPETAQRLKDAGFPQPEPKPGQYWCKIPGYWDFYGLISRPHNRYEGDFWAVFLPVSLLVPYPDHEAQIQSSLFDDECLAYAPTATDILRQLGKGWVFLYDSFRSEFLCSKFPISVYHENPAEAAALAWLSEHENSSKK